MSDQKDEKRESALSGSEAPDFSEEERQLLMLFEAPEPPDKFDGRFWPRCSLTAQMPNPIASLNACAGVCPVGYGSVHVLPGRWAYFSGWSRGPQKPRSGHRENPRPL